MTFAASGKAGISRQRGFWLRCFLGWKWVLLIIAMGAIRVGSLHAEDARVDCFYVNSVHVWRVQGIVIDQHGVPVNGANVEVLKRGADDPVATEVTNANGDFKFSVPAGSYGLQAKAKGFQPSGFNVRVDRGLLSWIHSKKLYVVLASGAKAQSCPPEITSKKKLQEYIRQNATQK